MLLFPDFPSSVFLHFCYVKKGKFTHQNLKVLKDIISAKAEKGKMNSQKVNEVRKKSVMFINDLVEYQQRCDLAILEKGRFKLKYDKDKTADVIIANGVLFLVRDNIVHKITDTICDSSVEELNSEIEKQKLQKEIKLNPKVFDILKKELGSFEIIL